MCGILGSHPPHAPGPWIMGRAHAPLRTPRPGHGDIGIRTGRVTGTLGVLGGGGGWQCSLSRCFWAQLPLCHPHRGPSLQCLQFAGRWMLVLLWIFDGPGCAEETLRAIHNSPWGQQPLVLGAASCAESCLRRMERPRGFIMRQGTVARKATRSCFRREAVEASGGHTFSDRVTLRPPAVCPAGITAWSWPSFIIPSGDPLGPCFLLTLHHLPTRVWMPWAPVWSPQSLSPQHWWMDGGKKGGRRITSPTRTHGSSYIAGLHTLETHEWPGSLLRSKLPGLSPTLWLIVWAGPRHLHRSQGF